MSQTTNENRITTEELRELLAGRRLPKWAPWAVAGGAVASGSRCCCSRLTFLVGLHRQRCPQVCCSSWSGRVELSDRRSSARDRSLRDHVDLLGLCRRDGPLVAILFSVIQKGRRYCGPSSSPKRCATSAPVELAENPHALIGTIEQGLMATIIAVPIGVMVAIYLEWNMAGSSPPQSRSSLT